VTVVTAFGAFPRAFLCTVLTSFVSSGCGDVSKMGDGWGGFFPFLLSPGFLVPTASSSPPDLTVAGERGGFGRQGLGPQRKWFGMSEKVVENKVGRAVTGFSGGPGWAPP